jgi:Transposase DDE domain
MRLIRRTTLALTSPKSNAPSSCPRKRLPGWKPNSSTSARRGTPCPRWRPPRSRRLEGKLHTATYRCPAEHCQACPRRSQCAKNPQTGRSVKRHEHEHLVGALKQRMGSDDAKRLYRRRAQTVELRFADVKEHRKLRKFSGRGLRRVKIEVGLTVIAHNALTIIKEQDLHQQHNQEEDASPGESTA